MTDALQRAFEAAQRRRFTGEPLTGFGGLDQPHGSEHDDPSDEDEKVE